MPLCRKTREAASRLRSDQRGGASYEYIVITAIGLFIAMGLGAIGVGMVDGAGKVLSSLYAEYP